MKDRSAYTAVPLGGASEEDISPIRTSNIHNEKTDIQQALLEDTSAAPPCCGNAQPGRVLVRLFLITVMLGLLWHFVDSPCRKDQVAVKEPFFENSFSLNTQNERFHGDVSREGGHHSLEGRMKWHPHHEKKKDSSHHGRHHSPSHEDGGRHYHGHGNKPCNHHKSRDKKAEPWWNKHQHAKQHHSGYAHGESHKGGHHYHHPWSHHHHRDGQDSSSSSGDNMDYFESNKGMDVPDAISSKDDFDLQDDELVSNPSVDGEDELTVEEMLAPPENLLEQDTFVEEKHELESASTIKEGIHILLLDEDVETMTREEEEEVATATAP